MKPYRRRRHEGIQYLNEAAPTSPVLTLKSLEAFEKAADGKATKIIIPSEIQGIAETWQTSLVRDSKGGLTNELKRQTFFDIKGFYTGGDPLHAGSGKGFEEKEKRRRGSEKPLEGKNIALIFEKTSTRTRCSFEVAAHDLGMGVTYLDPKGSQIGKKESIADTARVLGRMFDGIEYRGFGQEIVEELAEYAGVPVWNGLDQ